MHRFYFLLALVTSPFVYASEPVAVLPFEINLGHIYIQGRINDGKPINIVFDTGAAANLVSEEVATALGLKISGISRVSGASGPVSIEASRNNKLWLNEKLGLNHQTFLVMNLDHLGDSDYPLDAIIGANVLQNFTVEINFDEQVIRLYDSNDFSLPTGFEPKKISLAKFRIPVITGSLIVSENQTLSGPYLIDTGAALALRINSPLVRKYKLKEEISPGFAYTGTALGNESTDYIGRVDGFDVLGHQFKGIPIRMAEVTSGVSSRSDIDGILGLEILKRFNLIFDYKEELMYVQKSNLFDLPFRENLTGLKLKKHKGYLEVEEVIKSSAAWKAKIKKGDRIIAVDNTENLTYDQFQSRIAQADGSVLLKIKRGNKILSLSLKPFSMI